MNSEECRLGTFDNWHFYNGGPIYIKAIAANGFFATGNVFEVECNWCHCRLSDWLTSEHVLEQHVNSNPNCDFIIKRHDCGNIPLLHGHSYREDVSESTACDAARSAKVNSTLDLLTEKDRLSTFVNWPNPNITPESLAKAGFFYLNRSDEVQCAWCKGVIAKWEKQDNAFEEHRKFFPNCPRVQLGPLIEIANDGIRDLGVQQILTPKNPKYSSLHVRLRTYSNWPIPEIQKPEDLAQAGLYYQKIDDQVKCFHCNMGLRLWEKQDDPWFEHAKWYPMCEFVRLVKGVHYIQEVQAHTRRSQSANNHIPIMTIEEAMLTEPVELAINLGLNTENLRTTTQRKLLRTGRPHETIDELLEAVFNEQENYDTCLENTLQVTNESRQNSVSNTNSTDVPNLNSNDRLRFHGTMENVLHRASLTSTSENNFKKSNDPLNAKVKINKIEHSSVTSEEMSTSDRQYLEEENRKLKDARLCKVCLDEEVGVVYLPCGHLVTCVQCAPGVNQCPMCRTKIKGFVRTYLS